MRHRKRGRHLGRTSTHRRAMLRNLASALFLTEREILPGEPEPKQPGQIITTLAKAKEVRPLVERCIRIACESLSAAREAEQYATTAKRGTDAWRQWRQSEQWRKWAAARAVVVNARRRVIRLLGDKKAVDVLFTKIAPRYENRTGGYIRVLRLAKPRLGDAGPRALLQLVGKHDRVSRKTQRPAVVSS
jgi:large subunit ribosomal protein L17